ncbi:MAG TPA: phosphatase PAP2 family protein [Nocardioidaceae bacterium]|nr:phosphatase PAP2 family protein [Nocardioidaceae bacterium]
MSFAARTRSRLVLGAVLAVLVLAAACALVGLDLRTLSGFDTRLGTAPQSWTLRSPAATAFFLGVEEAFGTYAMAGYTVVAALLLSLRRHYRAAIWTVAVMVLTSLSTTGLKLAFHRQRPVWQDPVQTLRSYSFPSGHSSSIAAAAGIAIVLVVLLVRRALVQQLVVASAIAIALLVGLDRVFLGVHNPSDVVAGYALGAAWVCVGARWFDPVPAAHETAPELRSPVPTTRALAVVLNPSKVGDIAGFRAMVEGAAAGSGWGVPDWYTTTIEDPGRSMAEQAAISGAELVLVCGGDGTVRTVCAELAGTGISVGIVPAGTGNLLARNIGVPLFLQAAVDVALNGEDRAIDLVALSGDGIAEDEHFMVMAGMGFDAAIMEGANEQFKARVGWLAYVFSALRNLMFPAMRVEISLDDGEWTRHRARTVVVGNVGYLQAGMPLLPDAAIDDGILDVVILHPRRFLSWVPLVFRVLSKGKRTDDTVNRMTGRKVSVRASHDVPRQLDGDPIGLGKELHAVCEHGRLIVRVPR